MLVFGLAIFSGAFLLFLIQPLMAKFILPWFGGTPAVWTTCMLFFQAGLLVGYAYAHGLTRLLSWRRQVLVHLGLLALALMFARIIPPDTWQPANGTAPTGRILLLLVSCLGLPYVALAATSPLLQAWFSQAHRGVSPYRLYSLSNAGSLLALLAFPFVLEPHLSRQAQAMGWKWGLVVFVICMAFCGWRVWRVQEQAVAVPSASPPAAEAGSSAAASPDAPVSAPSPPLTESHPAAGLWLALPACSTALLLAITNRLCHDIAVIPFLWVLPLGLYLISYIICFDNPRWYARSVWLPLLVLALLAATGNLVGDRINLPQSWYWWPLRQPLEWLSNLSLFKAIVLYLGVLFCCCMVCHGELYRRRPPPERLTTFYLVAAAGGTLGGFFVAIVAPAVFRGYHELHLTLWLTGVLAAVAVLGWPGRHPARWRTWLAWPAVAAALAFQAAGLWTDVHYSTRTARTVQRNFYGVLKVKEYSVDDPHWHKVTLLHGTTTHGLQYVSEDKRWLPTSYYIGSSGVGLVMQYHPRRTQRRVGIVGLGTGSMAAWGRSGDYFKFYEINPAVVELARREFTYLSHCPAQVDIVLGDARLSLEREPAQEFDVLALDAFNSDAIPAHLLTREAFGVYLRHLRPGGVLAVHISNKYLNLEPVVRAAARHYRLQAALVRNQEESTAADDPTREDFYHSDWFLLARESDLLTTGAIGAAAAETDPNAPLLEWTDDRSDLFRILVLDDDGWLATVRRWLLPDTR
ncbi:MAG: fused MFS/spermidine synthase [Verrucomicrobiae bacterium]|nr:fused MFS/spermidine synthase [Verrucomicrobiae bacterium]